jgi:hypothetical protein
MISVAGAKTRFIKWNAEICSVDSVYQKRPVRCHLPAQTVCPRNPRKPSGQGRIAMGHPSDKSMTSFSFVSRHNKTIDIVVYRLENKRARTRGWHGQLVVRVPNEQKGMSIT